MKINKITDKLNLDVKGQWTWNASCLDDCSGISYNGNRDSAENCTGTSWTNADSTNMW